MSARVLYLTQTFPPEPGSTIRPLEQAQELQRAGHDVTVITAFSSYPTGRLADGDRWRGWRRERVNGVDVLRLATITAAASGRVRRLGSYLSFALTSALATGLVRRPDVVIASVPHLFTDLGGLAAARMRGARFVIELRDLVPETTVHAGVDPRSAAYRALGVLCGITRRRATALAVPYEDLRQLLVRREPRREDDVLLLPHGIGRDRRAAANRSAGRAAMGLGPDVPVALYVGSFAQCYGLPEVVRAAQGAAGVQWVLVGAGRDREAVRRMVAGLDHVRLLAPCDPRVVGDLVAAADVVLSPHQTAPELPYRPAPMTKVAEAIGLGRPVLAWETRPSAGPWLEARGAGRGVPWGSPELFGAAVQDTLLSPDRLGSITRGAAALAPECHRETTTRTLLEWLDR